MAFTRVLGRPIRVKPVFPRSVVAALALSAPVLPSRLRDNLAVMAGLRNGGYVSREPAAQKWLFGEAPSVDEAASRYCRDKALA